MNPGATAFTRMPSGATSRPTDFVNSDDRALGGGVVGGARRADDAVDRGEVHDRARTGRLHVTQRRPGAVEGAVQVGLDHAGPTARRSASTSRSRARSSRPSMRAAMLAMLRARTSGRSWTIPALFTRTSMRPWRSTTPSTAAVNARESVTSNGGCLPADLGCHLGRGVGVQVVHDEVGAVGGEAASDRGAETRAGTRDEGDASVHAGIVGWASDARSRRDRSVAADRVCSRSRT